VGGFLFLLKGVVVDHKTNIDKDFKTIYCTLEGELDIKESIRLSKSLREQAVELGYSVLYDARKLKEPKSVMPVHDLTVKLSSILDATVHRKIKVGFLYEPGSYDDYWQFYGNAAVERGLEIKIFIGKEEAIKWLSN
jgi:hypothetical protein